MPHVQQGIGVVFRKKGKLTSKVFQPIFGHGKHVQELLIAVARTEMLDHDAPVVLISHHLNGLRL